MKRLIYTIYILSILLLPSGCSNSENQSADANELTSIPEDVYLRLLKECDYVDIIFFDSPVSMSQSDDTGIQNTLTFVTPQVAEPHAECKPMGRISYMIQGEIIAEGDFYCTERCTYILFMEANKPKYANVLSANGVQFFQNILSQIQKRVEGQ